MQHSRKILLNGMVMYLKIIINTLLTLLATRIALKNLGADSFGLYNLLAGLISMLSFLNGALIISGQRFMSIAIGQKDSIKLNLIFNVCLYIHLLFSIIILVSFTMLGIFFISTILNIPEGMESTAYVMFMLMVVSSFVSVSVIPYSAMMNAKEDIYVFAFTEILSCGLRCGSAFAISLFASYRLEWYTLLMTLSFIIAGSAKVLWGRFKYPETKLNRQMMHDKPMRKQMIGFVGWNTLGTGATMVRDQGLAMLLNVFYGTVINAAYGIANQVSGLVNTIGATITTVFAPSIIQAHGAGDDERMVNIASLSSKLTFGLCSTSALPIIIFLPSILNIWLTEVPDFTVGICRFILIAFLVKQMVPGLNRAIYATGHIKDFMITLSLILISILPVGYILLRLGLSVYWTFVYLLVAQVFSTSAEIFYANKRIPILKSRVVWVNNILIPGLLFSIVSVLSYVFLGHTDHLLSFFSVALKSLLIVLIYASLYLLIVLNKEKYQLLQILKKKRNVSDL